MTIITFLKFIIMLFLMNITDQFKSYARYVYLFLRKSQHASLTDCKCRKLAPTNSDWTLLESISTLPLYAKFTNASRALKYSNSNTKTCNFLTLSQVKHYIQRNSFVYIYRERERDPWGWTIICFPWQQHIKYGAWRIKF